MKTRLNFLISFFIQFIISFLLMSCCEKTHEPDPANVTDIDGNIYEVIRIGKQLWMKENLETTKYNNGIAISNVTDSVSWRESYNTPAFCWYNNDSLGFNGIYGVLYNWHAVNTRLLCPTGWHVPSDAEWKTLIKYLGGQDIAGGKLKETGTLHWSSPNTGASNEIGFTALPGGFRDDLHGRFEELGFKGYWWSGTLGKAQLSHGVQFYGAIHYWLDYTTGSLKPETTSGYLIDGRTQGNSVRCIMD
jgi:uncharacterized protein (TIGR02145 family)